MGLRKQESIAWIVSSYGHDWRKTAFVEHFMAQAVKLGAIGSMASAEAGDNLASLQIPQHRPEDVSAMVADWLWTSGGPMRVGADGKDPAPWSVHLSFIPDPDMPIGRLTLRMDARSFSGQSERLWEAFRAMHSGQNTSHACIHPWNHWIKVRDRQSPLINSATLQTILWANYIGPDLMSRFERERLSVSAVHSFEWTEEGGVFLRLSENVLDALLPETRAKSESRRRAVAKTFLEARNY